MMLETWLSALSYERLTLTLTLTLTHLVVGVVVREAGQRAGGSGLLLVRPIAGERHEQKRHERRDAPGLCDRRLVVRTEYEVRQRLDGQKADTSAISAQAAGSTMCSHWCLSG